MRSFYIYILLLLSIQSIAQINKFGYPEIKNYPPEITAGTEQNWAITKDARGIIYVGNDEKGVLEYDGVNWRSIEIANKSTVRSLITDKDGVVYVGAVAEFGYLAPDETGLLAYNSLIHMLDTVHQRFTDVWKTYAWEDKVYFCSEVFIHIYDKKQRRVHSVETKEHTLFCFLVDDQLYSGAYLDGLSILKDTLQPAPGAEYYKQKNIYALTKYDSSKLLIACGGYGLSIYDADQHYVDTTFASRKTNNYLNENLLYHLSMLPDGNFLASTIYGGLVVLSKKGEIIEVIGKEEGLQDQTSFHSYVDTNTYPYPQIWTALSIGVAKSNLGSPIRKYNEDAGFQGLINAISSINGKLIIGTMTGLYLKDASNKKASFEKNQQINAPIWSFLPYEYKNRDVVLALSQDGLFEIDKYGKASLLDHKIRDRKEPKGSSLWGYSMIQDVNDKNKIFLGRESSILYLRNKNGIWYAERDLDKLSDEVRALAFDEYGYLWFGTKLNGLGRIDGNDLNAQATYYTVENGLPSMDENSVFNINDCIIIGTNDGFYRFDAENDSLVRDTVFNPYLPEGGNTIFDVNVDKENCIWLSYENSNTGWMVSYLEPTSEGKYTIQSKAFKTLPDFSTDVFYCNEENGTWFSKSNELYHFNKSVTYKQGNFKALVRKVTKGTNSVIFNGVHTSIQDDSTIVALRNQQETNIPHIPFSENNIEFRWSTPFFEQEEKLLYSFYLDGFSKTWSEWENVLYQDYTNLSQGNYTFKIKAKNVYGDISETDSYSFLILRPWYLSFFAFLAYIILTVIIVYVIIALYTRKLKNENIRLEGIILDRTAEIRKQKEELTDSIEYASRIQRALLPPEQILEKNKIDHFILFRPRDIVSGDFYWLGSNNGCTYIVAADCTGHGVPGAFMSMLGISFLDEIVNKSGVKETNLILDALKEHVITSLRQTGKSMEESTKDGMDLAMISINEQTKEIQFSGAYNPLYVVKPLSTSEKKTLKEGKDLELERGSVHNNSHLLYQLKATPMPIGISEKDVAFEATNFDAKGSTLYLFSDGYVDQFGGPLDKKFMSKNFKKLLLEIQDLSMEEQRDKLNTSLVEWMGEISQIDDVLVIGVKI